ncbi:MAG: SoxR reducing system RseC family protein [Gammaproteobacteria bacterium]|nr:SoxR reducing system RseC family protein [Gammaproteobacteria bacterium]
MLIECAHITAVHGDQITLESSRPANCARCAAGQGCGGGIFARLVASQKSQITVSAGRNHTWQPGQQVRLQLPANAVLKAAALVYILPLAGLMLGAALGAGIGTSDQAVAAGSLLGLLVAAALVWRVAPGFRRVLLRPVILAANGSQ